MTFLCSSILRGNAVTLLLELKADSRCCGNITKFPDAIICYKNCVRNQSKLTWTFCIYLKEIKCN